MVKDIKKYKVNTSESLSGLKEKHKIKEDEILAGNNNPEFNKRTETSFNEASSFRRYIHSIYQKIS